MRVLLALIALEFMEQSDRIWRWSGLFLAWAFLTAITLGFTALPMLLPRPQEMDPARLEVRFGNSMTYERAEFTPALRAALIPQIKIVSCIFSENVIRHHVRPDPASFSICGGPDIQVTVADNLVDITVSGIATIDKAERPFTVVLQHNPPSVTMDGLIVASIKIE